ncbi:hypothetical protein [Nocardia rhamnosiphila]|uniref:C2H2-type domain-containing protein n=1 Tax=Nocardia rhamnosiphila TaxID=426716 RepID=A0ABV2WIX2_9NOCA
MAHWSTGYADFHEEVYAPPPLPPRPPRLPCPECGAVFSAADALRDHVFGTHPVARPTLLHRGLVCGDTRLLVQRQTDPADWNVLNCVWARVDGADVAPDQLGSRLSTADGIVGVEVGNNRSQATYEFDFAVAAQEDLDGVDGVLTELIADGDITSESISGFYDRTLAFPSAKSYAGGIAEYLYWLAGRQGLGSSATERNHDKLNRAAHQLRDIQRPVALAITSVISFYCNHFDEAANRALSPRLHAVSTRLARMLAADTDHADPGQITGRLAHLEFMLMDEYAQSLVELCSHPLDSSTSDIVAQFDYRAAERYDRVKILLFLAEHHLATGDPRVVQLVRTAGQNGVPEHWVESRLDLITDEGSTWQTAAANGLSERMGTPGDLRQGGKTARASRPAAGHNPHQATAPASTQAVRTGPSNAKRAPGPGATAPKPPRQPGNPTEKAVQDRRDLGNNSTGRTSAAPEGHPEARRRGPATPDQPTTRLPGATPKTSGPRESIRPAGNILPVSETPPRRTHGETQIVRPDAASERPNGRNALLRESWLGRRKRRRR